MLTKLIAIILGYWSLHPFPADPTPPVPAQAERIADALLVASRAHQVAPALLAAVAEHESSYDPQAVSKTGDWGVWQLNPRSAWSARAAVVCSAKADLCLLAQANEAASLLQQHRRQCGSWRLSVAAYHTGMCRSPTGDAYARRVYLHLREIRREL